MSLEDPQIEIARLKDEVARWQKRAHDGEAALVQVDARLEGSLLRDCIDACMRNLMPIVVQSAAGPVRLMACDQFAPARVPLGAAIRILDRDGDVAGHLNDQPGITYGWHRSFIRRGRDHYDLWEVTAARNTSELTFAFNRIYGRSTGGFVCLLHPQLLELVVRDFAQMRIDHLRADPTQQQPDGDQ